ncbi:type II secretion system F family protein [Desulfogranum mediterraneum]|uniref:type II secretion system F family protein n=1 Tax=Desulfogranum mediterraneum TaxID=160661 RepID=UPI000406B3BC|nr:type II secretion system F family protein [Desulfogranum mediterraneum]
MLNIKPDTLAIILPIATFIIIILIAFLTLSFINQRNSEKNLYNRTKKWIKKSSPGNRQELLDKKPVTFSERITKHFTLLKKKSNLNIGIYSDTPLFYQRAGIYDPISIRAYQIMRYTLLLSPALFFVAYHLTYQITFIYINILITMALCYTSFFIPVIWLRLVAHFRKLKLDRTFPDAMDLLMICIEAGIGIDSAINRVSKELQLTNPELGKEFQILSLELKTGRPRNECLRNLSRRTDLPDIENLVSLLIQSERYGTGVANVLRVHAEEMRLKRYSRLEEKAAKLPPKLVVPMILFIFPALFVVIAGPTAIQVFRTILQR